MATTKFLPMFEIVNQTKKDLKDASVSVLVDTIKDYNETLGLSALIETALFRVGKMTYEIFVGQDGRLTIFKKHDNNADWTPVGVDEDTVIDRGMAKIYVLAFLVNVTKSFDPLVSTTRRQTVISTAGDAINGVFPMESKRISSPVLPLVSPEYFPDLPVLDDDVEETVAPLLTVFDFMIEIFLAFFMFYFGGFFEEPTVPIEEPTVPFVDVAKRASSTEIQEEKNLTEPKRPKKFVPLDKWAVTDAVYKRQLVIDALNAIEFYANIYDEEMSSENLVKLIENLKPIKLVVATFFSNEPVKTEEGFWVIGKKGSVLKIPVMLMDYIDKEEEPILRKINKSYIKKYEDEIEIYTDALISKTFKTPIYTEKVLTPTGYAFTHDSSINFGEKPVDDIATWLDKKDVDRVWKTVATDW
jgi:hypothetical protein